MCSDELLSGHYVARPAFADLIAACSFRCCAVRESHLAFRVKWYRQRQHCDTDTCVVWSELEHRRQRSGDCTPAPKCTRESPHRLYLHHPHQLAFIILVYKYLAIILPFPFWIPSHCSSSLTDPRRRRRCMILLSCFRPPPAFASSSFFSAIRSTFTSVTEPRRARPCLLLTCRRRPSLCCGTTP